MTVKYLLFCMPVPSSAFNVLSRCTGQQHRRLYSLNSYIRSQKTLQPAGMCLFNLQIRCACLCVIDQHRCPWRSLGQPGGQAPLATAAPQVEPDICPPADGMRKHTKSICLAVYYTTSCLAALCWRHVQGSVVQTHENTIPCSTAGLCNPLSSIAFAGSLQSQTHE